jgi:pimeloyl-ACP methyl ester carboxylesterase
MTEETYQAIRRANDEDRAEQVGLSGNAKIFLDPDSGHNIQLEDPRVVAQAVAEVVAAVMAKSRLTH